MTTMIQFSKSDFVNPDVLNAMKPHPVYGYAHGKGKSVRSRTEQLPEPKAVTEDDSDIKILDE
ncbi:hypothetical protein N7499_000548 [Penicillium canescens]|uniref:Uncharacterized protein n=1 Tax=Penicillium canescens TaxID=5083 RepID=A0AAD6II81_PENCN|nr:uncharacterized protein N7446_011250 [Penicillium canescens]KAJ6004480.1 hypothetical protein N7522_006125 [Penicillium canescens]KAJ6029400.1 hypothetical protein N7444_012387 [Penicillium canescens]KAJ6047831.1 hypothetical protein N7460_003978 [Penicillium canescens]KAJ6048567.1 hypothetical protein N7446_011250 [Penicillium canescens]KAJ6100918.1 hypothetical protein N7499_000548 [Penicillium canescens]